jgi:hypothetical protein
VREVRTPNDRALDRAHRLLKRIFPRAELLPLRDWRETLREREAGLWTDLNWHLLVAHQGRQLVGAASGSYIGSINVGLIGYVAVVAGLRGHGVGERLRRGLRAAITRDARRIHGRPLGALIGEVHAENPWLAHLVRERGVLVLDFPYCQPSLHRATRHVQLVLYYEPLHRRRRSLPADEVRRLIYTLWRRSYRIDRPLAHDPFRRMLRSLPRGGRVGSRSYETLGPRTVTRRTPGAGSVV